MRRRLNALLLAACLCGLADSGASVDSVVSTVRSSLRKKNKDGEVAAALEKIKPAERLEDRVIEILESEGAGPQTLGALQHLRDASRAMPVPPAPPPGMTPPPPPSADEEHEVWKSTRRRAMDYTGSLPDFICTETIHRLTDPAGNEQWQPSPTVVADLTFFEKKEQYKLVSLGGRPSDKSILDVGGSISQGEFGSLLASIFSPGSATDYRWDHWTILRKRPTYVFFYRIAASHRPHHLSFGVTGGKIVDTVAAQRGYAYIDQETNSITRISEEAEDIPADFPVQKSSAVVDYDYADVGGGRYLLPTRAEVRLDAGPLRSLNSVEFQNYRKFTAATSVKYGRF